MNIVEMIRGMAMARNRLEDNTSTMLSKVREIPSGLGMIAKQFLAQAPGVNAFIMARSQTTGRKLLLRRLLGLRDAMAFLKGLLQPLDNIWRVH